MSAAALFTMSTLDGASPIWILIAATGLTGFGMSFGFTAFTVPIQNAMPISVLGVVTSTLQFARLFGQAAGSAVFGAVLFAIVAVSIVGLDEDSPRVRIADPEVIVAVDELEDIRAEYLSNPDLGEEKYESDLAASRDKLADGLSAVFRLAAVFSLIGVVLAYFTFAGGGAGVRGSERRSRSDGPGVKTEG